MKKLAGPILLVFLFSSAAIGQLGISKGILGGLNLASVSGSDASSDAKGLKGYAAGVFVEFNIPGPLSVEAEALYSQKGFKMTSNSFTITDSYAYADIPVLLKIFFPIPAVRTYLSAGPSFSILLNAKRKTEGSFYPNGDVDIKDLMSPNDVGGVVGLGAGFSVLRVDARYNFGFTTLDKNGTTKIYNRVVAIYVGLEL